MVFCGQVEVGGKMLPYAAVTHSKAEPGWRRLETEVAKGENNEGDGKNPRWEATLGPMDVYDEFDTITVTVYDKKDGRELGKGTGQVRSESKSCDIALKYNPRCKRLS